MVGMVLSDEDFQFPRLDRKSKPSFPALAKTALYRIQRQRREPSGWVSLQAYDGGQVQEPGLIRLFLVGACSGSRQKNSGGNGNCPTFRRRASAIRRTTTPHRLRPTSRRFRTYAVPSQPRAVASSRPALVFRGRALVAEQERAVELLDIDRRSRNWFEGVGAVEDGVRPSQGRCRDDR